MAEILQTILQDDKLEIVEVISQKDLRRPIFHGVILDCVCKLKTNEIVNIEVQVALNDNIEKRVRYNLSMLTIENAPKDKKFKYGNIQDVILIMI